MKLSVVVPVFNAEKYLTECIDSVVKQTFQNMELILVDDGSSDRSGMICDDYVHQYPFITVIHQRNQGISCARNAGMATAKGEYIAFVDSDDVLDRDFYEVLIWALEATESDVAACSVQKEYSAFRAREKHDSVPTVYVSEGRDACMLSLGAKVHGSTGFVWNKVYRRAVIGDLLFSPQAVLCEDLVFNYEVMSRAKRACVVDRPMYHYRYVQTGLSQSSMLERYGQCLKSLSEMNQWIEENAPFCKENVYKNFIFWNTKTCERMLRNVDMDLLVMVQKNLESCRWCIPKCSARIRVLAYAILHSWHMYRLLGGAVYESKQLYIAWKRLKAKNGKKRE